MKMIVEVSLKKLSSPKLTLFGAGENFLFKMFHFKKLKNIIFLITVPKKLMTPSKIMTSLLFFCNQFLICSLQLCKFSKKLVQYFKNYKACIFHPTPVPAIFNT